MTAAEGAVRSLENLVASGRFPPGTRLPVEADLAAELNVSRSTLREAVRALTQAGLFDVRQGDGSYVAVMDPPRLFGGLRVHAQVATGAELAMILEARSVLEPQLVRMACERRTNQQLGALGELFKTMDGAPDEGFIAAEANFVAALIATAGSPVLGETASAAALVTMRLRSLSGQAMREYHTMVMSDHRRTLDALVDEDCAMAVAAVTSRLTQSERWLNG